MKARMLLRHLRILPSVIVLVAALLAIKGVNLVQVARAEAAQTAPAAPQPAKAASDSSAASAQSDDPAVDETSTSAAEVDVLTSLSKRRTELDAREKALDMRANLLTAAEQRVDAKIADLKSLQTQIQTLLGHRDDAEQKQITALVKVYSAMKPRDAARIFNTLDETVLLEVAGQMKPDSLAAVMAAMNPEQAQSLTVKLAGRLKLPKAADLAPATQLAAAGPAPGAAPTAAPASAAQAGTAPPTTPTAAAVPPPATAGASPPAASGG